MSDINFLNYQQDLYEKYWVLWENILVFIQKMSVHFCIVLVKWNRVKPASMYKKYVENEISTFSIKKREEQNHNPTSKTSVLKLLKNCH